MDEETKWRMMRRRWKKSRDERNWLKRGLFEREVIM